MRIEIKSICEIFVNKLQRGVHSKFYSMEAVEDVLGQYLHFIEQNPKGPNAINESHTIFPRFDQGTILKVCDEAINRVESLNPLVYLSPPIVYVGDIHGNVTDLIHILHIFGYPPKANYLFLGDYVDRGSHSIEVITILMALLCKFPDNICLLRGNHEFPSVNRAYGFYDETLNSYGTEDVWKSCNALFSYLPFAAIVGNQVFCVHGGLSTELINKDIINEIELPVCFFEDNRLISDLVWSDPVEEIDDFEENTRGSGVLYGKTAIATFLQNAKLKVLLRAHQCVANGYSFNCNNTCITLFSSSNYHRLLQNKCGVIFHKVLKELSFYSLLPDSDIGVKPSLVMAMPTGNQIGLKSVQLSKAQHQPIKSQRPISMCNSNFKSKNSPLKKNCEPLSNSKKSSNKSTICFAANRIKYQNRIQDEPEVKPRNRVGPMPRKKIVQSSSVSFESPPLFSGSSTLSEETNSDNEIPGKAPIVTHTYSLNQNKNKSTLKLKLNHQKNSTASRP